MLYVLVGFGPNDVQVPALVWSDRAKAVDDCHEILGEPSKTRGQTLIWEASGEDLGSALQEMYTSYYGGCGECYRAALVEVQEGEPFIAWNLD